MCFEETRFCSGYQLNGSLKEALRAATALSAAKHYPVMSYHLVKNTLFWVRRVKKLFYIGFTVNRKGSLFHMSE